MTPIPVHMRIGAGQEYQVGTIDSEAELPQMLRAVADQLAPRQGANAETQRQSSADTPEVLGVLELHWKRGTNGDKILAALRRCIEEDGGDR